jgi:hypothetical protein
LQVNLRIHILKCKSIGGKKNWPCCTPWRRDWCKHLSGLKKTVIHYLRCELSSLDMDHLQLILSYHPCCRHLNRPFIFFSFSLNLFLLRTINHWVKSNMDDKIERATEDPISGSLPKQEACKKYRGREKNSHFGGQHLPSHVKRSRRWILMD